MVWVSMFMFTASMLGLIFAAYAKGRSDSYRLMAESVEEEAYEALHAND